MITQEMAAIRIETAQLLTALAAEITEGTKCSDYHKVVPTPLIVELVGKTSDEHVLMEYGKLMYVLKARGCFVPLYEEELVLLALRSL